MKNIFKYLIGLTLILGVYSCQEEILDLSDPSNPTDASFFANEAQLQLALNAIYGRSEAVMLEGQPLTMVMDQWLTDNGLYRITGELAGLRALSSSSHDANSGFATIYANFYRSIARTNNMLGKMENAKETLSQEKYDDFQAQTLAMRAFFYSGLVKFFGDVPYLDFNPTTPTAGFVERTSKETIVDNILADLDLAASLIDKTLTGAQERMTLTTIYALKAQIALTHKRFDLALAAANASLSAAQTQGISLDPDYGKLFRIDGEHSSEILMRQPFNETWGPSNAFSLRMGYRGYGQYSQTAPTQNLIDAYPTINGLPIDEDSSYDPTNPWGNRDPRLHASVVIPGDRWGDVIYESHPDSIIATIYKNDPNGERGVNYNCRSKWPSCLTGYLWRKYVDEQPMSVGNQSGYIDFIILRLGEVYLIKAEAEIESSTGSASEAVTALHALRRRAWGSESYPKITTTDKTQLRKILRIERRIELANEGHRYTDGLRWGILEEMRAESLVGRHIDLPNSAYVPTINDNGVTIYTGAPDSQYDQWKSRADASNVVQPTGYEGFVTGNWYNAIERNFTSPRDYLLPIPQNEIDLYKANGIELTQNTGY